MISLKLSLKHGEDMDRREIENGYIELKYGTKLFIIELDNANKM